MSTSATPTVTGVVPSSTLPLAPPAATSSAPSGGGGGGGPTSSPLLFFVALGFGVVFTNLWIIVGVKYCFRYNQRHRRANQAPQGEPIDMTAMQGPRRRRREKKLMTMDEVNERFPMQKYKTWMALRAEEGLPTAGGVAAQPEAVKSNQGEKSADNPPPDNTLPTINHDDEPLDIPPHLISTPHAPLALSESRLDIDEDEIHSAVNPDLLATPGDSCAICIDTLEDDDDVRGLTCGHAFHASCLDPWLTSRRACCPLCKADYYIPKPRSEAEIAAAAQAETERLAGRRGGVAGGHGTSGMPTPPPYAFLARSRLFLPARFGGRSVRPQPIHPAVMSATPPQTDASRSWRRWHQSLRPQNPLRGPQGTASATPSALEAGSR